MVDSVIFWAFALISVGAGLCAILCRSVIYAALCLIAVFFSIAGIFLLNNADFLAISQIIIYAVGLTIIMLFAIMFTGDKPFGPHKMSRTPKIANRVVLVYMVGLLLWGCSKLVLPKVSSFNPVAAGLLAKEGSTGMLGALLFNEYAIPFELASILLLAAMIGAIVIAKKRFMEEPETEQSFMDESSAPPDAVVAALRAARLQEPPKEPPVDSQADNAAGVK